MEVTTVEVYRSVVTPMPEVGHLSTLKVGTVIGKLNFTMTTDYLYVKRKETYV